MRDFIHLDATRNIAGQLSRQTTPRAFRAIAQAFATESGGYLTRNHMEIWADFAERALGITREELFRWTPPTETIASRYVTSWYLVHCPPEEAIAAFHLGPPPRRPRAHGQGRARASARAASPARACCSRSTATARHPLAVAFERLGIDPDLADYFFRLHREIEPFEQDEGLGVRAGGRAHRPAAARLQARLHHEDPLRATEGRGAAAAE